MEKSFRIVEKGDQLCILFLVLTLPLTWSFLLLLWQKNTDLVAYNNANVLSYSPVGLESGLGFTGLSGKVSIGPCSLWRLQRRINLLVFSSFLGPPTSLHFVPPYIKKPAMASHISIVSHHFDTGCFCLSQPLKGLFELTWIIQDTLPFLRWYDQ